MFRSPARSGTKACRPVNVTSPTRASASDRTRAIGRTGSAGQDVHQRAAHRAGDRFGADQVGQGGQDVDVADRQGDAVVARDESDRQPVPRVPAGRPHCALGGNARDADAGPRLEGIADRTDYDLRALVAVVWYLPFINSAP